MLLQERDRILEERHALLSFAKGGEGATTELCRQLEQIISEKQALGVENGQSSANAPCQPNPSQTGAPFWQKK